MGRYVKAGDLEIWTEQVGDGPDVLLIGGLGDTVESWQFQLDGLADRYRMTAFDNRGAGRTAMPEGQPTVEAMADDAAAVLRGLDVPSAHVAGFSGGSIIAQELALRHPELVRSLVLQSTWPAMDQYMKTLARAIHWQAELAPDERAFLEFFFLLVYTPRAHNNGMVSQIIEDALAFPHQQSTGDFLKFLDAFVVHETGEPAGADQRAHAGPGGRGGPDEPAGTRPGRGPSYTGRTVRGDAGGIPPALPGGSGRMECARRTSSGSRSGAALRGARRPGGRCRVRRGARSCGHPPRNSRRRRSSRRLPW